MLGTMSQLSSCMWWGASSWVVGTGTWCWCDILTSFNLDCGSRQVRTSHQHQVPDPTTQEDALHHILLDNWDIAPTPSSRYNKRNRAPQLAHVLLTTSKHLSTGTPADPHSEFKFLYNKGTHHLCTVLNDDRTPHQHQVPDLTLKKAHPTTYHSITGTSYLHRHPATINASRAPRLTHVLLDDIKLPSNGTPGHPNSESKLSIQRRYSAPMYSTCKHNPLVHRDHMIFIYILINILYITDFITSVL